MKRFGVVVLTLIASLIMAGYGLAQGPSDAAMDAVFRDLGARIGQNINWRGGLNGRWQYEEIAVADSNLGCPPGNAAPGITRAWKMEISLDGIGTYDYRLTFDGTVILLCSGTGVGAPGVTAPGLPTPIPANPGESSGAKVVSQPPSTTAPTAYSAPLMAFISDDGNVRIGAPSAVSTPTSITGDALGGRDAADIYWGATHYYGNLTWSPDGTKLAFTADQNVYIVPSGSAPIKVAAGIFSPLGIAWSSDGAELAYAMEAGMVDGGGGGMLLNMQVQAVPAAGGAPRVAGSFQYGVGCGGGGFSPATVRYFNEAGYGGSNQRIFWTVSGFVHPTNCTGTGVALSGFNGQRLWTLDNYGRAALSLDRARLAVIGFNAAAGVNGLSVTMLDVASGAVLSELSLAGADQVTWASDGSLIFSTRTLKQIIPVGIPTDYPLQDAEVYSLSLWKMPAGGAPTQLFAGEGFSIAAMSVSLNTPDVVFSLIDSDAALVNALNSGTPYAQAAQSTPGMRLWVTSLNANTPGYPFALSGYAGRPAFSPTGQFIAIPAPIQAVTGSGPIAGTAGDNPLGLVVGGKAQVTPGGSVNVRRDPLIASDNVVFLLRPGDVVTILAGPTASGGLRWWRVQRDIDALTGWVVDQYTNAQGKIEDNLAAIR